MFFRHSAPAPPLRQSCAAFLVCLSSPSVITHDRFWRTLEPDFQTPGSRLSRELLACHRARSTSARSEVDTQVCGLRWDSRRGGSRRWQSGCARTVSML